MILGKKIIVIMPAYNAERTLKRTVDEIPPGIVDDIIVVDDHSSDRTVEVAKDLGLHCLRHSRNSGYGANQKTCYREALKHGGDIVVMMHPDYQYTPKLIPAMCGMIASGIYDVVLGSRILGKGALRGGMPLYKYFSNRMLTLAQNILMNQKLSEYHTGYRAFSREVLQALPLMANSDDFIFDNQFLAQTAFFNFRIGEVSCPTLYHEECSSINFSRSVRYGLATLGTSVRYRAAKWGLAKPAIFFETDATLLNEKYPHAEQTLISVNSESA